jgi:hypothetical protein
MSSRKAKSNLKHIGEIHIPIDLIVCSKMSYYVDSPAILQEAMEKLAQALSLNR